MQCKLSGKLQSNSICKRDNLGGVIFFPLNLGYTAFPLSQFISWWGKFLQVISLPVNCAYTVHSEALLAKCKTIAGVQSINQFTATRHKPCIFTLL